MGEFLLGWASGRWSSRHSRARLLRSIWCGVCGRGGTPALLARRPVSERAEDNHGGVGFELDAAAQVEDIDARRSPKNAVLIKIVELDVQARGFAGESFSDALDEPEVREPVCL